LASAAATTSPRTHPHLYPHHPDNQDDEDAASAEATEDSEHLVATPEPDLGLRAPGDTQFQHNPSIGGQ
jgi:hypothetical protein